MRAWIAEPPDWVDILPAPDTNDPLLLGLDLGERCAITLGLSVGADLILIDERRGAAVARSKRIEVTGTLGVLDLAASEIRQRIGKR